MKRSTVKELFASTAQEQKVLVKGWVRNRRGSKNVAFVALNDGTTLQNLQIVVDFALMGEDTMNNITVGCSISVEGILKASAGSGQSMEVVAEKLEVLGLADAEKYPLQPKKHSLEFLRENAHLRFRTNTFGAITRIRHAMIFAIHSFFNERGFYNIHTPIVTASDAEGAGEMFQVTTFDLDHLPRTESGEINYKLDFFGRKTNLTVSGQRGHYTHSSRHDFRHPFLFQRKRIL